MLIIIDWKLGQEQGTFSCSSDREAEKFNTELYGKKLAMAGLKITQLTSFENKLYSYKEKKRKAYGRKAEQLTRDFAPVLSQAEVLKSIPLSISIKRA